MLSMKLSEKLTKLVEARGSDPAKIARVVKPKGSKEPSRATVYRWFNDKAVPDLKTGLVLARHLAVPLEYLADDKVDELAPEPGLTEDERLVLFAFHSAKISAHEANRRLNAPQGFQEMPPPGK